MYYTFHSTDYTKKSSGKKVGFVETDHRIFDFIEKANLL